MSIAPLFIDFFDIFFFDVPEPLPMVFGPLEVDTAFVSPPPFGVPIPVPPPPAAPPPPPAPPLPAPPPPPAPCANAPADRPRSMAVMTTFLLMRLISVSQYGFDHCEIGAVC